MPSEIQALCQRFGYPAELESLLESLADACREAYPELHSLVLSGSAATGDFVWRRTESGAVLLSDIDAIAFAGPGGSRPERLAAALREWEARHPSPLFQIDVSVNPLSALSRIPRSFQMVEIGAAGVVLAGEDVRGAFPTEYDPAATRQAFLYNLWKPIHYWAPPGRGSDVAYVQAVARLILDLPLLALCRSGHCIPGHQERARRYLEDSGAKPFHSPSAEQAVAWACAARRDPPARPSDLERTVARFAFEVASMVDGRGAPPSDPDRELVARLAGWLPRRTPRRFAGELRALLTAPGNPLRDLRWLMARKEASGAAALFGLHAYVADGAEAEPPAGIAARLREFTRGAAVAGRGGAFVDAARGAYWDGLRLLHPSIRKQPNA